MYHESARHLVWIETDSRGFTVIKAGDFLGMGGQLTWRWESAPFTYKGQLIRMAGTLFTSAPDRYTQNIMMSVDGVNQRLGNPHLDKVRRPPSKAPRPLKSAAAPRPGRLAAAAAATLARETSATMAQPSAGSRLKAALAC
jgi:hypothetical protein